MRRKCWLELSFPSTGGLCNLSGTGVKIVVSYFLLPADEFQQMASCIPTWKQEMNPPDIALTEAGLQLITSDGVNRFLRFPEDLKRCENHARIFVPFFHFLSTASFSRFLLFRNLKPLLLVDEKHVSNSSFQLVCECYLQGFSQTFCTLIKKRHTNTKWIEKFKKKMPQALKKTKSLLIMDFQNSNTFKNDYAVIRYCEEILLIGSRFWLLGSNKELKGDYCFQTRKRRW